MYQAYPSVGSKRQRAVSGSSHSTIIPRNHDTWQKIVDPASYENRENWIPTHMRNWLSHSTPYGAVPRGAAGTQQRRYYNENLGWVMTNTGEHNGRITNPGYGAENRISNFYVYRIYTMFRVWMRRAIERVRVRWAKAARLPQIIGNRGGRTKLPRYGGRSTSPSMTDFRQP